MLILSIKTDQPEAEIGLYQNDTTLEVFKWQAHRQLSETIHIKISKLLKSHGKDWHDISGVICFEGPGSFTGLRIGLTLGNSLAANLQIPVVATGGKSWVKEGTAKLQSGQNNKVALPKYGRAPHITKAKK